MDFKSIVDILFKNKNQWNNISDKDKESFFFIFNRFMAKKYPIKAQFFNKKDIDKASAMDVWFKMLQKEYKVPYWFWTGPTKRKDPTIKDWKILQDFWKIGINDIYLLCDMFPQETKDEIKRIQLIIEESTQ